MTVWISTDVLAAITAAGTSYFPLETGGILVGWRDGEDKIVADLVGPGPKALHGRHAFLPDHGWQIEQIDRLFHGSGGDLDYLGDWHTHPAGIADVSPVDLRTLKRLSKKVRGAVMVIAAGEGENWTYGAWGHVRGGMFTKPAAEPRSLKVFDVPAGWRISCGSTGGPAAGPRSPFR